MSFAAAVDHLHGLTQELSPTAPRRKFELDHMRVLAHALGDPQRKFPAVLIAGTNGKGSTAATLAAILTAAGYRTGLYTSPHLTRVTERIRTSTPSTPGSVILSETPERAAGVSNGAESKDPDRPDPASILPNLSAIEPATLSEIPEETFARLYFHVDETAQRLVAAGQLPHHPSFFEILTALAFLYFAESRLDIAILEVGLGGRLDATNIVEPVLSVITDIALDHQDYLGNTITAIAREKAGILRLNGTLITLPQHPEANQAIGEAAIALNVRGINAADYLPETNRVPQVRSQIDPGNAPLQANHYDLNIAGETLHVRSPLAGQHQQRNIALAIATAIELRNHLPPAVINQPSAAVIEPPSKAVIEPPTKAVIDPSSKAVIDPSSKAVILSAAKNPRILSAAPQPPEDRPHLVPGTADLVPNEAIEAGIAATSWPGRLELLPPNLLLDVAHNPAGAWTLRAAIATLPESQPRTLIFSCLRDKDLTEMSQILFPLFDSTAGRPLDHIVFTPVDGPRAASLEDMMHAARALDIPAQTAASPAAALALARALTPPNGLILATGSIYLIGALRELAVGL